MTPLPKRHVMDSPPSTDKLPIPPNMKRGLLLALEQECAAIQALVLRKHELVANKAFAAAREMNHGHCLLSLLGSCSRCGHGGFEIL